MLPSSLSMLDRRAVRAIAEAMFSTGEARVADSAEHAGRGGRRGPSPADHEEDVLPARLDGIVDAVEAILARTSTRTRSGLRLALWLLRLSPIVLLFRLTTLERLPCADRTSVLARLERSRLALLTLAFVGWRTILTLLFYEDADELRRLGYRDERVRYRRALPVLEPPARREPSAPPLPVPLESGVRLGHEGDDPARGDSEPPQVAAAPTHASRGAA